MTRSPTAPSGLAAALFLLALAANTALLAMLHHPAAIALPLAVQALLLIGVQEAKHQCVHRNFLRWRRLNDAAGIVFAAMAGLNFVAYRHFHFQHHRHVGTGLDPEGELYRLSWRTRWIWLLAPIELPWIAFHTHRAAQPLVPVREYGARRRASLVTAAIGAAAALLAWRHPGVLLRCWLLPQVLASWIGFLLAQAEHYGAARADRRPDPAAITHDVVLPAGLGWLTLHAGLHRVHHRAPATRWHEAAARLRADPTARPIPYAAFARRWVAQGPRRWAP